MKKFKENNASIYIWMSNNSWRKWNSKRLISSRNRPAKVSSGCNIQEAMSSILISLLIWYVRAKSARCAAGWRAIHRGAIPVDVCGKKELLDLACVPLHISRGSPRPERRIKAYLSSFSRIPICYLATLLSNDEAFKKLFAWCTSSGDFTLSFTL